jgi:hypothetical protein
MNRKLTIPTVHMNGTQAAVLVQQIKDARRAVRDAIVALEGMDPNGRDYYPQGEGAYERARREHTARIAALAGISAELAYIHEEIVDQE